MNKMWILILTVALMGVAFWLLKGVVDRQVAPTAEQALTNATVASGMTKEQGAWNNQTAGCLAPRILLSAHMRACGVEIALKIP